MARNPPIIAQNLGARAVKAEGLHLSDVPSRATTDYAGIIVGDGVPSGGYGRASGTTLVYLRKDAGTVATAMYVSVNGGTNWTAMDPSAVSGASITINDTFALQLGTPGTDLVLTADGTDGIVTGTGDLVFNDSVDLKIGTGKDIGITWDGTDLLVSQAASDSVIKWGVSGAGINHLFYGDTATRNMTWDQSNDQLLFDDNAKLAIGTGAGAAGDITFSWDATKLVVAQLTANSAVEWGVDGAGLDQVWYGDTASAKATWDQSADTLIFSGVAGIQGIVAKTNGATAITTTRAVTRADSGGVFTVDQGSAYTITVAQPAAAGERYLFQCVAPGAFDVSIVATGCTFEGTIVNDVTSVIPATGSTLKFATGAAALGDNIELISTSTTKFLVRAVTSAAGGITIT